LLRELLPLISAMLVFAMRRISAKKSMTASLAPTLDWRGLHRDFQCGLIAFAEDADYRGFPRAGLDSYRQGGCHRHVVAESLAGSRRVLAGAKECCADSNACGTLGYGKGEVTAHSHGQNGKIEPGMRLS
jgi:hypothetical protein